MKFFEKLIIIDDDRHRIKYQGVKKIMTLKEQQMKFDNEKWQASIVAGEDLCGTYAFCSYCTKTATYPCARAARKAAGPIRVATVRKKK